MPSSMAICWQLPAAQGPAWALRDCKKGVYYAAYLFCRQDEEEVCRLGVTRSSIGVGHRRWSAQELAAYIPLGTC